MSKLNKHISISDIIFAVIIAVLAVVFFVVFFVVPSGNTVEMTKNGEKIKTIPLYSKETYVIEGDYTNTVVVDNGCVYVESTTCPNKICQQQGKMIHAGESIVCAPNRVVITITGKGDVDAVTK